MEMEVFASIPRAMEWRAPTAQGEDEQWSHSVPQQRNIVARANEERAREREREREGAQVEVLLGKRKRIATTQSSVAAA